MRAYHAYLVLALGGVVAFVAAPPDSWWTVALAVSEGGGAGAVILVGARRHRSVVRGAWALFAVGIALNALGSLVEAIVSRVFHNADPFPGIADVFYLALYPALVAGVFLVIRKATTGRDWGAIVDSTTI